MASINYLPYKEFEYHPHQKEGVQWMLKREETGASYFQGGILADDMGLGKTWQLVGLILNGLYKSTLLVVPASMQDTWIEALKKAEITILQRKDDWKKIFTSNRQDGCGDRRVYLTSYDRLVNACKGGMLNDPESIVWDRIVCDEAQMIRNGEGTARFDYLMRLPPCPRWLLTGTPFQNSENDLRNLFTWLGADERVALEELVTTCLIRRTYADLRDSEMSGVPKPYIRETLLCKYQSRYELLLLQKLLGRIQWGKKNKMHPFMMLELFLRMNQAMAHPHVYHESMKKKRGVEMVSKDWSMEESGKTFMLRGLINRDGIKPMIVFCTFSEEIKIVRRVLEEQGYEHTYILDGSVDFAGRQRSIDEGRHLVESGKQNVAYIVQWVAGGAGLNLQFCSSVVLYTQHWNPAVIQQAIGRAHRIGQKEQVHVYSLVFGFEDELNMDKRMRAKQQDKMSAAQEILPTLLEEDTVRPDKKI